jgi:hypothetical protein
MQFGEEFKLDRPSLCSFHVPTAASLPEVRDYISNLYVTTGNITFFTFFFCFGIYVTGGKINSELKS